MRPRARVAGLRGLHLGVRDVAASARFYTLAWGLAPAAERAGSVYLRATGASHYVLALHPRAERSALLLIDLLARTRADVDALHARLRERGAAALEPPAPLPDPGGGYGFRFRDPEGRALRILAGDAGHADAGDRADRPRRITHIALNSADAPSAAAFFVEALGFRLSDRTRHGQFVRCGRDHHAFALFQAGACTLDHVAFDMPDLDSLMRAVARMQRAGHALDWGIGRHRLGHSVFAYFVGPEDVVVEYSWDILQVEDDRPVPGAEQWPDGPLDLWGLAGAPSARMAAATRRVAPD